jgi:hypothetical protein
MIRTQHGLTTSPAGQFINKENLSNPGLIGFLRFNITVAIELVYFYFGAQLCTNTMPHGHQDACARDIKLYNN